MTPKPDVSESPPLIAHVERELGPIMRGLTSDRTPGIPVAIIEDRPVPGATAYCTLGLSKHCFHSAAGRKFRQELLGCSWHRFDELAPEAILSAVAEELLATHTALVRGEVIGPRGPLVAGSALEALYCSQPVYFSDALATFAGSEPATVFVWLVPISAAEARYVADRGWSAFEDHLVARDPDLLDLLRPSTC
jgi:hypothetical protein